MLKSRRAFLQTTGVCAAALGMNGVGWSREFQTTKAKPDVVIYDGRYPGWPWITRGDKGTLFCVFREGTIHGYSADGKAMFTKSDDGGRTWSPAKSIVDHDHVDDRNVAITELSGGELLAVYNTYTAAKESQAMTLRSSDGGETWSKPRPLDQSNTRTKSAVVVLANGDLLLPYYIAPGNGALAALSQDNGRSWKTIRIPDVPGFLGDEWDALEVEPGRIIGIFRNSAANLKPSEKGFFWKSESHNGGQTWQKPRPTNVQSKRANSPPQIVFQGKQPTLIYADRRMVSVSAVKTSDPDFLRWDLEQRLPCYLYNADQSPIKDGSYPVSAAVGAYERLIVDYEIRETSRRIVGYRITFPRDW